MLRNRQKPLFLRGDRDAGLRMGVHDAVHFRPRAMHGAMDYVAGAVDAASGRVLHDFTVERPTIELMEAPADSIRERGAYNLAGLSFAPAEMAAEISRRVPGFTVSYTPDFRDAIARTWPRSIDDSAARADWGWRPRFDIAALVEDMLAHLPAHRLAA